MVNASWEANGTSFATLLWHVVLGDGHDGAGACPYRVEARLQILVYFAKCFPHTARIDIMMATVRAGAIIVNTAQPR